MMRFLLDGMLGKLSRWLRILGHEAQYLKNGSDKKLLSHAKDDSLILLTSDAQLYRTAISKGVESFLINSKDNPERLADLAHRFNLKLEIDLTQSRCPTCGSPIKPILKDKATNSVPPTSFKVYQSFWACTNNSCAKLYWQGSHWKKIEETLRNAREILERKQNRSIPLAGRGANTRSIGATSSHNFLT